MLPKGVLSPAGDPPPVPGSDPSSLPPSIPGAGGQRLRVSGWRFRRATSRTLPSVSDARLSADAKQVMRLVLLFSHQTN